ncbi:MAG: tRNA lysidine(34) synthetase TilS [Lachnospiraceae bacterium]|nr:tRNA lysidine(34) synthetase TilS [Lachnospiraceae bacterium]
MKEVLDYIKKNNLIEKHDNIILGISGGADSVCLLFILQEIKDEYGLNILGVHINHLIRDCAGEDERFALEICERFGVECVSFKTDCVKLSEETGLSLEETGRNERYRLFNETGEKKFGAGNYKIAVAHHMDDLAETLIFNMTRGTGINGLASIKAKKGNIIRPLLGLNRERIEEILKENGLSHVEDETNSSDDYARNKIRHKIIPVLNEITPKATNHMASLAALLSRTEDYLDEKTEELTGKYVEERDDSLFISEKLMKEHPAVNTRVLHKALKTVAGRARDISAVQIEALAELFELQPGKKRDFIYNMEAVRVYDGVQIRKKTEKDTERGEKLLEKLHYEIIENQNSQNIPKDLYTKWFDYDKIKNCPSIRFRQEGDFLTINDQNGRKLLSDYMINEKIPADRRDEIPLLADGNHIIWVVGYRISNTYKVTPETTRILVAKYENQDE